MKSRLSLDASVLNLAIIAARTAADEKKAVDAVDVADVANANAADTADVDDKREDALLRTSR